MIAITNTSREKTGETWRDLIAYIVEAYHDSLRAALPRLEGLADQVARERRMPMHVLDWLLREFSALADTLRTHLIQQEDHLFPMIRHVCEGVERAGWACHLDDPVEELMDEATREDQEAVASVKRAEHCFSGMDCIGSEPLVAKLVKGLRELREDLEEHVKLETKILFPVVRELLRGNYQGMERVSWWQVSNLPHPTKSGRPLDASISAPASYAWLDEVMEEMGYRDHARACRALKSVLHALRDRLSVNKAIALGTRLPKPARVLYYEDWQQRWDRVRYTRKADFLCEIAKSLKEELDTDSERTARSIFRVLAKQMAADEIEGVRDALPGEIRSLWPSEGPTRATAELIIADQETG